MALAATIGLSACSQNKSGKTPTETKQNNQKQVKEKKMKDSAVTHVTMAIGAVLWGCLTAAVVLF